MDPVDIDSAEAGARHGYFVEGEYGEGPFSASYMPLKDAEGIIEKCAEMYLHRKTEGAI